MVNDIDTIVPDFKGHGNESRGDNTNLKGSLRTVSLTPNVKKLDIREQ